MKFLAFIFFLGALALWPVLTVVFAVMASLCGSIVGGYYFARTYPRAMLESWRKFKTSHSPISKVSNK